MWVNVHGVKNMEDEKMSEEITITKKEYEELLDQVRLLNCLRSGGVDNWGGYEFAIEIYQEGSE